MSVFGINYIGWTVRIVSAVGLLPVPGTILVWRNCFCLGILIRARQHGAQQRSRRDRPARRVTNDVEPARYGPGYYRK